MDLNKSKFAGQYNKKPFKASDKFRPNNKNGAATGGKAPQQLNKKDLKKQRRMTKLSSNFQVLTDMKKIWETLRR
jgi:hypothetical protein